MAWGFQSPETWLALALLIVTLAAITCAAFSRKPDARMEFFLRLLGNLPSEEAPSSLDNETVSVQAKEKS